MAGPAGAIDLGTILRVHEMVMSAAQTEATMNTAAALARSYSAMRDEMLGLLGEDELPQLRREFERHFPEKQEPAPFNINRPESSFELEAAAADALMDIQKMGGWIKGLIKELTFKDQMEAEARAKAELERRPPTGFASPS